jgi:hypothetical protein
VSGSFTAAASLGITGARLGFQAGESRSSNHRTAPRTTRAAAWLVLGSIRTDRRIVGLLGLPRDDPVADVDLPGTRTGAVHTMGGPNNFVVAPPIAIEDIACTAALPEGNPMVVGFLLSREKTAELQERVGCLPVDPAGTGGFIG